MKKTFLEIIEKYVRDENKETFLKELLRLTNKWTGSTVWSSVMEILEEQYGYTEEMLIEVLK